MTIRRTGCMSGSYGGSRAKRSLGFLFILAAVSRLRPCRPGPKCSPHIQRERGGEAGGKLKLKHTAPLFSHGDIQAETRLPWAPG